MSTMYTMCLFLALLQNLVQVAHGDDGTKASLNSTQRQVVSMGPNVTTQGPLVSTTYGKLEGFTTDIGAERAVDVFLGVPFAKPPIGPLRLKAPESPLPWQGVRSSTSDSSLCVDTQPAPGESEDCLYLDLYRPRWKNSSLSTNTTSPTANSSLSVFVWVHGGGWQHGSKNKFNGTLLAARGDIIVVVINYRLGPLGFFSTEDDEIPGNFGMLDQIAALKWIQSNIAAFGGDPGSVTVVGESAGSQAVSLLLFSPLARDLFARAIMQSNVATELKFIPAPSSKVHFRDIALKASRDLGCLQSPGKELLSCLQNQTFREFVDASQNASRNLSGLANSFKPRIETTFGVLRDYPIRLLAKGEYLHVDTMRGFNSQENGKNVWDNKNDGLTRSEFLSNVRKMLDSYNYIDVDSYVNQLEDLYITNITDPFEIRARTIAMKTDLTRLASIVRESKLMRQKNHNSKHFLYQFDYFPSYQKTPKWQGVLHALNVPFNFGFARVGNKHWRTNASDIAVAHMVMDMWSNFAKFGDPTPQGEIKAPLVRWKQCYPVKPWYLVIKERLELRQFNSDSQVRMLEVWEKLVTDYLRDVDASPDIIG